MTTTMHDTDYDLRSCRLNPKYAVTKTLMVNQHTYDRSLLHAKECGPMKNRVGYWLEIPNHPGVLDALWAGELQAEDRRSERRVFFCADCLSQRK